MGQEELPSKQVADDGRIWTELFSFQQIGRMIEMKKRLISMCLVLVLSISLLAVGASAAEAMRGNGYESISFTFNGKGYTANLMADYSSSAGGRTRIYTEAAVEVKLSAPTVRYNTKNYGYTEETGYGASAELTERNHSLATEYVKCRHGMDQVINYRSISGMGTVISNGRSYSASVYRTP